MAALNDIGLRYATDKASHHHDFLNLYERRLSSYREQRFVLVEIGVYNGGSVKTWADYFPNATIVGIDINPDCARYAGDRVNIRIGDASDADFMFDVIAEFGKPTIVIDDGSHRWDHQIASLQMLFPLLRPGGVFIVEDLDTSFEAHLRQAPFQGLSPISAFDYLTKLSRCVTGEAALGTETPHDLFIASFCRWVSSVEFARRTAIIGKKLYAESGPS